VGQRSTLTAEIRRLTQACRKDTKVPRVRFLLARRCRCRQDPSWLGSLIRELNPLVRFRHHPAASFSIPNYYSISPRPHGSLDNVKRLSREQVATRKEQAARFTETALGGPRRADEIRDESVEEYARRRGFEITNPQRRNIMARKTTRDYRGEIADLKEQVADLQDENESLQERLDSIVEVASGEEEEETEDDECQD